MVKQIFHSIPCDRSAGRCSDSTLALLIQEVEMCKFFTALQWDFVPSKIGLWRNALPNFGHNDDYEIRNGECTLKCRNNSVVQMADYARSIKSCYCSYSIHS